MSVWRWCCGRGVYLELGRLWIAESVDVRRSESELGVHGLCVQGAVMLGGAMLLAAVLAVLARGDAQVEGVLEEEPAVEGDAHEDQVEVDVRPADVHLGLLLAVVLQHLGHRVEGHRPLVVPLVLLLLLRLLALLGDELLQLPGRLGVEPLGPGELEHLALLDGRGRLLVRRALSAAHDQKLAEATRVD